MRYIPYEQAIRKLDELINDALSRVEADVLIKAKEAISAQSCIRIDLEHLEPVNHGKFIPFTDKQFYEHFKEQPHNIPFDGECSICGAKMFNTDKYCGECGARMMKEDNDEH